MKKDKTLIIHVGMPKTGTSSIQKTLHTIGEAGDYKYADLGPENHGGHLTSAFSDDPFRWRAHRLAKRTSADVSQFNNQVFKRLHLIRERPENQILSGESLWHLDEMGLTRLADFFSESFKEIKILGYIRPPQSYLRSALQQLIKKHGHQDLDVFKIYPGYRDKIERFDRIFGRDNVQLKVFQSDSLVAGDVVQDFCHQLRASIDPSRIKRVHDSLSLEATALMFVLNRRGAQLQNYTQMGQDREELAKALQSIGHRRFRLSRKLIDPVLSRHEADIQWVEKRLGCEFTRTNEDEIDAIQSAEQLEMVALEQFGALDDSLSRLVQKHKATPEQLAHVIEKFRIFLTGRNSQGIAPYTHAQALFTQEQLDRMRGPAAALREFAIALADDGRKQEAINVITRAIDLRPDAEGLKTLRKRWMG